MRLPCIGPPVADWQRHGHSVTSALLFGSIQPLGKLPVPYCHVDHWRVLDVACTQDSDRAYHAILRRIQAILAIEKPEFVNCSIGPDLPADGEVDSWTAVFDDHFQTGEAFAAVAVGNNGGFDSEANLHLILPPSDGANCFAIGAHDGNPICWNKATYSAVAGTGTLATGKPDGLGFGGTKESPFFVLDASDSKRAVGETGTSFAAPDVLRSAIAVRAVLGRKLSALALRALLIESADANSVLPQSHMGWGKFTTDVEELIECTESSYTVIYEDDLSPKEWRRYAVAIPNDVPGEVSVSATICFACGVDPCSPGSYSRASLETVFRPDNLNIAASKKTAEPFAFFGEERGMTERARRDAKKWETTLHNSHRFLGVDLKNPVFELHYIPRAEGRDCDNAPPIRFAMVITAKAALVPECHREVELKYHGKLELLRPIIDIRINV